MPISESLYNELICPCNKLKLRRRGEYLEGTFAGGRAYPIIDGIPILICDEKSLFSISDSAKQSPLI